MSKWSISIGGPNYVPFYGKGMVVAEAVELFYDRLKPREISKIEVVRDGDKALTVELWSKHQPTTFTEYRLKVREDDLSLMQLSGSWFVSAVEDGNHHLEKVFSSLTSVFDWYLTRRKK